MSHTFVYIRFIQEMEVAKVKAELAHHPPVSVIFDGSTHQGETPAVLVRFVYEEFESSAIGTSACIGKEPECQRACQRHHYNTVHRAADSYQHN